LLTLPAFAATCTRSDLVTTVGIFSPIDLVARPISSPGLAQVAPRISDSLAAKIKRAQIVSKSKSKYNASCHFAQLA
jgi:hypothetical protein